MKNRFFLLGLLCLFFGSCSVPKAVKQEVLNSRKDHIDGMVSYKTPVITKKQAKDVSYFPISLEHRVTGQMLPAKSDEIVIMPTYSGKEKEFIRIGRVVFTLQDQADTLTLFKNVKLMKKKEYQNLLFLPFKDVTNGESTYGGGRYIDLEYTDIVDGKVVIDFNQCYNPWCAYSDGFNCPIPPIENHLSMPVFAGEKVFKKK